MSLEMGIRHGKELRGRPHSRKHKRNCHSGAPGARCDYCSAGRLHRQKRQTPLPDVA